MVKVLAFLTLLALPLWAGASPATRKLLQVPGVLVGAPMPEGVLIAGHGLQNLAPTQEVMQAAQMLPLTMAADFSTWVSGALGTPEQGLAYVAAAFSDAISRGEARQLAMVIGEAFPTPIEQQQTITPGFAQVFNAYALAIMDQISRMNTDNAGNAIYWALSGAGGDVMAWETLQGLDALQANIGCSEPLRSALSEAAVFATLQQNMAPAVEGTTTVPGQGQTGRGSAQGFLFWLTSSPSLSNCFQQSSQAGQMFFQQMGNGMEGTQGTTGMEGMQGTTGTGMMGAQP